MKVSITGCVLFLIGLAVLWQGDTLVAQAPASASLTVNEQRKVVADFCIGCHNSDTQLGNFSWDKVDLEHPERTVQLAERLTKKLRSGMMPPAGSPRPPATTMKAFATAIEDSIDKAAMAAGLRVSSPELHRVNRTEYRNSVKDLLGIDVDVAELLPPDATTSGFDNMAEALTITPALMSAYIRAAERISRAAIGDRQAAAGQTTYKVSRLANQMRHVEGTPFGTRGGTSVMHDFPADGEYSFNAIFYYDYPGELVGQLLPVQMQGQELEISVDGERVGVIKIDPDVKEEAANYVTPKVRIAAGQRRLAAAFVSKFDGPVQDHYRLIEQTLLDTTITSSPNITGLPHLQSFSVTGPFNATGVSDSRSRKKILTCRPASPADEQPCASQIIGELAAKAFRRPSTPEDLEGLLGYYNAGRKDRDFDSGIRAAIQAILAKPEFLFRFEQEPAGSRPGSTYQISDLELATRLAYFMWSTLPDAELVRVASAGQLKDPSVLEAQLKRMLADPRSEALARNFAGQWLRLAGLQQVFPEALLFPNFTLNLAQSMRREVELLFHSLMREDKSVLDLMTADYTFVDEVLARHYGIPNIVGPRFKRVQLTEPERFGLLGKAGILTMTSMANRTSPVARGKYILEVLTGTPPPPPPPLVPPLKESVDNQVVHSVRARMEQHRNNPACLSCHQIMDPIGMAMENFDAVGVWRRNDGGQRVDPSGEMFDGTRLDGPLSVRRAVLDRSELFLGTFTRNLLAYSVGRVLDDRDMPTVRMIQKHAMQQQNRFSAYLLGIVTSPPFRMREVAASVDAAQVQR